MKYSPKSQKAILAALILLLVAAIGLAIFRPAPDGKAPVVAETVPETKALSETLPEVQAVPNTERGNAAVTLVSEAARTVVVKTVDEFLAAIGSNTSIILEPGIYDLTQAADYGKPSSGAYRWEDTGVDGYQLVIQRVENLFITGFADDRCEIVTAPRYAAVLAFEKCSDTSVVNITAGHTDGPGSCVGSVIRMEGCKNMFIGNCILYGCGTYGVEDWGSKQVDIAYCDIKECSLGAVFFQDSENIHLRQSRIFDCGIKDDRGAYYMFYFDHCRSCAVSECTVTDNNAIFLVDTTSCKDIYFVSNQVDENSITGVMFNVTGAAPMIQNCFFGPKADSVPWVGSVPFVLDAGPFPEKGALQDLAGKPLTGAELKAMDREFGSEPFTLPETVKPAVPAETAANTEETRKVKVSTVDELLAAIAPNTTVVLAEGTYDLSTASDYGTGWEEYYRWNSVFDGFELEIMNVTNFHIQGAGQNRTILTAVPRYAEVLLMTDCDNISIEDITAGHTEEGYCTGGVLNFQRCNTAAIDGCGLYGCGIYGITASYCDNFTITDTEIYDCSYGAVSLNVCENMAFQNCDIHDCPYPLFQGMAGCVNITMDGEKI